VTLHRGKGEPVEAAYAVPIGSLGMLVIGAVTATANGRLGSGGVLALAAIVVTLAGLLAEPLTVLPLGVIGWFTVAAVSHPSYGELQAAGTGPAALVLAACAGGAAGVATIARRARSMKSRYRSIPAGSTLDVVTLDGAEQRPTGTSVQPSVTPRLATPSPARRWGARPTGISDRRLLLGLLSGSIGLPILTALLALGRGHLALVDDVLLYLVAVLLVTMIGGFWPAVLAAVAAALLLNWFFTPPVHTWTIEAPQNILALLLFVTSAVTVSSVVHLAARRHALATDRSLEAGTLLELAQTVLGGEDTPQAVLAHLAKSLQVNAELQEHIGAQWIRIAGVTGPGTPHLVAAGTYLRLAVYGDTTDLSPRLLDGFAAQAASACERQRLRIQAGQAEALAEGNRMRTALLTAVSHDLRTPLAAVKAAVSTLRQTDVAWTPENQADLLATIEEGADRLDTLIANLLDMSRLHTGALQPFLRPTALDEVAPLLVAGLEGGERLQFEIPDALPLLATDPGLLERALANLAANALRYSPPDRPPTLVATADRDLVMMRIVDHGPGISPAERIDAFEPFQQLGDQRTGTGVGLGLAVAKGFIEALGGRITAESTPGGGLTMCVDLPTAPPEPHPNNRTRAQQ